ncbi:MAG: conserved membrane protein of unknown function [Nitrospira sp.]|nr:MAG: conserved membrane protein of unknown function [Nitrospira sp.]
MTPQTTGAACGLLAAFLFGVSVPLIKLLSPGLSPLLLAGLLYSGAGLFVTGCEWVKRRYGIAASREVPFRRTDRPLLIGMACFGGVIGPLLLLSGLQRLSGTLASLLLNLEAPFTMFLAVGLFRGHITRQEVTGVFLILLGAGLVGYMPFGAWGDPIGVLALTGATLCWALDNDLSQRLSSLRDPLAVTRIKALSAGLVMITMALVARVPWPDVPTVCALLALGAVSYGLSFALDAYALRLVGAAREAAYFATAPFVGALASILLLGERWGRQEGLIALLMVVGVLLLVCARHAHLHTHEVAEHDHLHGDDDRHHDHHEVVVEGLHAHQHRHRSVTHDHPHVSDLHHRHPHT